MLGILDDNNELPQVLARADEQVPEVGSKDSIFRYVWISLRTNDITSIGCFIEGNDITITVDASGGLYKRTTAGSAFFLLRDI